MPERDGYIPGVPCWVDTSQPDPEAALPFYRGLFGWEFENVMPEGSEGSYFIGRIRGGDVAAVGSIPEGAPPMATWNTYIWVDSADETAAKARDAGGGVVWSPSTSWTRGGWPSSPIPRGGVLRLAGEGAQGREGRQRARLAELQRPRHPGPRGRQGVLRRRVRLEDAGAARRRRCGRCPATAITSRRATRACASRWRRWARPTASSTSSPRSNPIADDDSDTPAHWSVTFGVDDADATAAKARELGGEVVAGPVDAPWTRMAVIKDPQGATFIASQFVPENKDLGS